MSANVRSTDTASVKLRSASIDQFRFLAFVGVLFIHFDASWGGGDDWIANFVRFGSFVGRFAVPFFFITAGYFLKLERGREGATIWGYVKRLFVPFLVWDGFYLLTDTIANPTYYLNEMTKGAFWRDVIINGGPGYHLWFLSSLFLCLAMVIIGRRFLSPRSVVAVSALFFSVGLVCGPYAALLFGADNQVHFFTRNGPFFGLLFVALGACGKQALDKISLRAGTALAVGGFALLTFECWWIFHVTGYPMTEQDFVFATLPFGVGMFAVAKHFPWTSDLLAKGGRISLGCYAAHLYFVKLFAPLFDHTTLAGAGGFVILSFAAPVALAYALSRMRLTKPLVA